MNQLFEILREGREKLNINQTELAKRSGVNQQSISNYENGLREPDYETLKRLIPVLGIQAEIAEFFLLQIEVNNRLNEEKFRNTLQSLKEQIEDVRKTFDMLQELLPPPSPRRFQGDSGDKPTRTGRAAAKNSKTSSPGK